MLKIAVQKKGRLSEKSQKLLRECGIALHNGPGKLKARARNFPLEVLYLRDDDIPQYVSDGVADIGIVGENVLAEKDPPVRVRSRLGFASCRLSLAVPRETDYPGLDFFQGRRIATSYPRLLQKYLLDKGISAQIEKISGSVEIAPGIGLADAICDIVSTGSTLLSNGLKEVETIFRSQAVLISTPELSDLQGALLDKLLFRIQSVRSAANNKYILLNAPNEQLESISSLIPGMKSPTILPLAQAGWSSLHSVVPEDEFWEIIDRLRELGAEGILVIPIEKMVL